MVSKMSAAAIDSCSDAANASRTRQAARSSGADGSAGIASNHPSFQVPASVLTWPFRGFRRPFRGFR